MTKNRIAPVRKTPAQKKKIAAPAALFLLAQRTIRWRGSVLLKEQEYGPIYTPDFLT